MEVTMNERERGGRKKERKKEDWRKESERKIENKEQRRTRGEGEKYEEKETSK
jgi:hypothetical protein